MPTSDRTRTVNGPCTGLRVVDFTTSYPGALATMVLADAGAEVIKVEPPRGDPTRLHYASVMWHRGKKSVVLDLRSKKGLGAARSLLESGDLAIESFRPGVAHRLGIDYGYVAPNNPALVYCSITGFGDRGPLSRIKAYEGIVQAATGRFDAFSTMVEKNGPVYGAQPLASYGAAMLAIHGMMSALHVRSQTGLGQRIDTSLLRALTCFDIQGATNWHIARTTGEQRLRGYNGGPMPPYMAGRTRDGRWLQLANLTVATQWNYLNALGLTHLFEDPRYAEMPTFQDPADQDAVHKMCLEKLAEKDLSDWMKIFMTSDVASEPFRSTQEGLTHEQVLHNGDIVDIIDQSIGHTRQLGPLARFTETAVGPQGPAPILGEHTDAVLEALHKWTPPTLKAKGGTPKHPLAGITVMEFASYIAVPFVAALLADLGARVIKVEPITGDLFRSSFPKNAKTLQGKESLSLDLKDPRCQEALHRLVAKTDMLIHNFRPGVPERLGIDYQRLRQINPEIIYIYSGAYGSTGPHSHRTGFHPIAGAIAGNPRLQLGTALPPPPDQSMTLDEVQRAATSLAKANEGNPDPVTSLALGSIALMALRWRDETGRGQYIETSMMAANLYANADDALSFSGKPDRALTDRGYNGLHALYRLYPTKQGWVFLAAPEEGDWDALLRALHIPEFATDPRFATKEARRENDEALARLLLDAFRHNTAEHWQTELTPHDVACVKVFDGDAGDFVHTTPWISTANLMVDTEHHSLGKYRRHAPPYTFSLTPSHIGGPNCYLGEHTRSILNELGYDKAAIHELEQDGASLYTDPATGTATTSSRP